MHKHLVKENIILVRDHPLLSAFLQEYREYAGREEEVKKVPVSAF